jgi:hypothetical protein
VRADGPPVLVHLEKINLLLLLCHLRRQETLRKRKTVRDGPGEKELTLVMKVDEGRRRI